MTAPAPAMGPRAVTPRLPRTGLDGRPLSVRVWLLLAAGTVGGLVFTGVYLAEGATRAGYRALAFPVLRLIAGAGLVMDGLFAQDPSGGYPPGARAGAATIHGQVHTLFAVITITALAAGCFVLAARFAAEPLWRRWAVPAAAAGVAIIVFIAAFGAAGGHGGLAGLWERAAGGATSVLTVAVLTRLAIISRPGVRARRPGPAARG